MGTDLTAFQQFTTAKPAAGFGAVNPQDDSLSEGIGQGYGVIHYKGKVWTLRHNGQSYTFVRPDDGSPINYIDLVIVRQARGKSKSYYPAYDPASSDGKPPICSSLDGIKPDIGVAQKQAEVCALCPRNVWKTDASGRKTRECTDYKRLAVLLMPAQTQRLLGEALIEPVFLRIPPASLSDLAKMGTVMDKLGWHYSTYVTRVSFDVNTPHPKMVFTPIQQLTDKESPTILELRESTLAKRITGEDQTVDISGAALLPAGNVQPTQNLLGQHSLPPQTETVAPPPAQTVVPPPQTVPPMPSGGGFLELEANKEPAPTPPNPAGAMQTEADTGAPKESDNFLDDAVNALLAKR